MLVLRSGVAANSVQRVSAFFRYEYFSKFGEVASITVALDNGILLDALSAGRVHKLGTALSTMSRINVGELLEAERAKSKSRQDVTPARVEKAEQLDEWAQQELSISTKALHSLYDYFETDREVQDQKNHARIDEAVKGTYPVARVFCIFEHEAAQRACLGKLSNGIVAAALDIGDMDPKYKFRGTNVLNVHEAPEPTGGLLTFASLVEGVMRLRCDRRALGKAKPENNERIVLPQQRDQSARLHHVRLLRVPHRFGLQNEEPVCSSVHGNDCQLPFVVYANHHRSGSRG